MYKPTIYIENQRLDLYNDETISIISSVQNIEDISRTFNDFSQSFTVPASKTNNKIFQHYYNSSINNGFDARVRHPARIEIQSVPFKTGTIRLEGCEIVNNLPESYKLTFFGELIDLKEVIGDDYLSVLDVSEYDMDYNSNNIITGMTTGFSSKDYIFPMISTERQWFYNTLITENTYEDKLANIAWNGSIIKQGLSWTSVRPALKIMRIIEAIEARYGITFSRDFLGTAPFDNLYLWLANEDTIDTLTEKTTVTNYDVVNQAQPAIGSFNNTTGKYVTTDGGAPKLRQIIFDVDSSDGVVFTIQLMNNDQVLEEKTGAGDLRIDRNIPGGFSPGANIYGRILTTAAKDIDQAYFEIDELSDDEVLNATKGAFSISGSTAVTSNFMPKIKVIDFLLSIIKTYNLSVVPTSSINFDLETLDVWYANGNVYDISKYVDTSGVKINRSKIYREISFKFQEPTTILGQQYKTLNNTAYGDLETKLKNSNGTPLDGGEFEIEVEFEQMVYEKLLDLDTDSETNIVYGLSLDKSLSSELPTAHMFYAIESDVSSNSVSIVQDNNVKTELNTTLFTPSHVNSDSLEYSTVFGSEINENDGGVIENSLFKLYYDDYITDSFSSKRRIYNYKARLPLWILGELKLNDRLIIGADRYIINEMTVNITTQMVDFELLNDIYNIESDIDIEEGEPSEPTPEPVIGLSFGLSSVGTTTKSLGCMQVVNATKYTSVLPLVVGSIVYDDIGLTTPFLGDSRYYKIDGGNVIRIMNDGRIIEISVC